MGQRDNCRFTCEDARVTQVSKARTKATQEQTVVCKKRPQFSLAGSVERRGPLVGSLWGRDTGLKGRKSWAVGEGPACLDPALCLQIGAWS